MSIGDVNLTEPTNRHNMLIDQPDSGDSDLDESEEQKQIRSAKNKANLLEWVTEADFAKEFNLVQLAEHPFMLDEDEETQILGQSKLLKLIKM